MNDSATGSLERATATALSYVPVHVSAGQRMLIAKAVDDHADPRHADLAGLAMANAVAALVTRALANGAEVLTLPAKKELQERIPTELFECAFSGMRKNKKSGAEGSSEAGKRAPVPRPQRKHPFTETSLLFPLLTVASSL